MIDLDTIPPPEIARRLRVARENANKSQEEAAYVIGLSQSGMSAIENGERSVQIRDIRQLARSYGLSLNALMRHEAIHVNLIPKFRRLKNSHSENVIKAAKELNVLVSAEVELENILGLSRVSEYPAERDISAGNLEELGEQHARELRKRLGIGAGPATNIFSLIELQLGIRLYQRKLDMGISGLFVYDDRVGACILLNADHSLESRVYSAAHEVGHFIVTRLNRIIRAKNIHLVTNNTQTHLPNRFWLREIHSVKHFSESSLEAIGFLGGASSCYLINLAFQENSV